MTAASTLPLHMTNACRLLLSSVKPMSRIICNSAAYRWLLLSLAVSTDDVLGSATAVGGTDDGCVGGVVFDEVAISSSPVVRWAMFDNEFNDAVPAKSNAAANWLRLMRWLSLLRLGDACGESPSDDSDESSAEEKSEKIFRILSSPGVDVCKSYFWFVGLD